MNIEPDILVVDRFDRPVVVVEAKKSNLPEGEWAQDIAKRYAQILGAPFAMAVTPLRLYLWRSGAVGGSSERVWKVDSSELLAPLYEELQFDPETVSADGFEDLVTMWLEDTGALLRSNVSLPDSLSWLRESGVDEYLADGFSKQGVQFEAVR